MPVSQTLQEYLQQLSSRVSSQIMSEIEASPGIKRILADLNSLGIVCLVDHSLSLKLMVREGFVPPRDLSEVDDSTLDSMFTAADREELRRMMEGR